MKTITLSVPDELYEKAARAAAVRETSVDALVLLHLTTLADESLPEEDRIVRIDAAFDAVENFSASDRLTREQIHDRAFTRELDRRQRLLNTAATR